MSNRSLHSRKKKSRNASSKPMKWPPKANAPLADTILNSSVVGLKYEAILKQIDHIALKGRLVNEDQATLFAAIFDYFDFYKRVMGKRKRISNLMHLSPSDYKFLGRLIRKYRDEYLSVHTRKDEAKFINDLDRFGFSKAIRRDDQVGSKMVIFEPRKSELEKIISELTSVMRAAYHMNQIFSEPSDDISISDRRKMFSMVTQMTERNFPVLEPSRQMDHSKTLDESSNAKIRYMASVRIKKGDRSE